MGPCVSGTTRDAFVSHFPIFGWFKEPPFRFNFAHPPLSVQVPKKPRGLTAISPLQVDPLHPPAASSPPDTHPSSSISYALLPISCAINSITRAQTSSLPTGAPHSVSTEHDHDSQRVM